MADVKPGISGGRLSHSDYAVNFGDRRYFGVEIF